MGFFAALAALLLSACGRIAYDPIHASASDSTSNDGGDSTDGPVGCPGFDPPPQVGGGTYFVGPTGSDTNPGTETLPFLTIQHAADIVAPGDTVLVEDGVYTGPAAGGAIVASTRGGALGNWVWFRARNRWGARLDGRNNTSAAGWRLQGGIGWVRIEGFEIFGMAVDGSGGNGIECYSGGHDSHILGNHIHDVGRICTDASNAEDGVLVEQPNVVVEGNLIHDIGRFAPGEAPGCIPATTNYENHDHGIDLGSGLASATDATVRNNVVYNCTRGWPIQIYGATLARVRILNNTFATASPYRNGHITIYDMTLSDSLIANNVFYDPQASAISMGGTLAFTNVLVQRNLTLASAMTNPAPPAGMAVAADNVLGTDALLRDPIAHDEHLRAGSPAIDAGLTVSDVTVDFDGCTRPHGAAYDIGAFEF